MKTKIALAMLALASAFTLESAAQISVATALSGNGINNPFGVALDADFNIYLADSANHRILKVDPNTQAVTTLAGIAGEGGSNDGPSYLAHFFAPQGMVLARWGGTNGLVVADTGNNTIRFVNIANGEVVTLAGQAGVAGSATDAIGASAMFNQPNGVALDTNNSRVYIADAGNNAVRVIDLSDPVLGVTNVVIAGTTLLKPTAVAVENSTRIWVADTFHNSVKQITLSGPSTGTMTTYMGSDSTIDNNTTDNGFGPLARFYRPRGLLWLGGTAGLLIADTDNHSIRQATNHALFGPTNYAVRTFAGTPGQAGFVDATALSAKFNKPMNMVRDTVNNAIYVVDWANSALRRIQYGLPAPAVAAPQIGWVDFPPPAYLSLFHPVTSKAVFNNDVLVAILAEPATETHFELGDTPASPLEDTIPNPTRFSPSAPTAPRPYSDGFPESQLPPTIVSVPRPKLTIKAIGLASGRLNSPVVQSQFEYVTATPGIIGQNPASFRITDATINARMYYTIDGSDPDITNNTAATFGPVYSDTTIRLTLNGTNGLPFKIQAFRDHYSPSFVLSNFFTADSYIPNRITFGLTNGQPSSKFIARPGQYFYAPVTLQLQPEGETMYSLQFNVGVTNGLTNLNTGILPPAVLPIATNFDFDSMLMSQVPPDEGDHYPPNLGQWYLTIPPYIMTSISATNLGGTNASTVPYAQFVNTNNNILGVGWLFRQGYKYTVTTYSTNLVSSFSLDFDTTKHDLISYSIPHDTLFTKDNGVVVVGAYSFQVPTDASLGDEYFIQLGSPSATRDGIGAPGADVEIRAPANSQRVLVGTPSYLVGDAAPFRWLNAGDFGNDTLDNSDVMQVFQSGLLGNDMPPRRSDLFLAMDSAGARGAYDPSNNYYTNAGPMSLAVFDGSETNINEVVFGDGDLDVVDLFVTFRRSLDPSLLWFRRFWTNGQFVAVTTTNLAYNSNNPSMLSLPGAPAIAASPSLKADSEQPSVSFKAGDAIVSAGQTIQIPITATIVGDYPLRVLGLSLTVVPLDGSPGLTQAVQFVADAALGPPTIISSSKPGNYTAAWLNGGIAGLSGNASIGTLVITVPANAPANAAYAVYFNHASASPNGLVPFPNHEWTGLVTLSSRTNSCFNDGIPDSWRLRWFGTIYNQLSQAGADADGDGASNWQEFKSDTNPNDSKSCLRLSKDDPGDSAGHVIRWPSMANKQYVVEKSSTLFTPGWVPVSTNAGTGGELEYSDTNPSPGTCFYRVRVLE